MPRRKKPIGTFIDLFAGCGGFSLGLGNAGWQGLFAIEKDPMAFDTLRHNLVEGAYPYFDWPSWLPKKAMMVQALLANHKGELKKLKGRVDLIVGGPPCQGFSMAGRRNDADPRNKLSQQYLNVVGLVKPKFVVIENVRGFNSIFSKAKKKTDKPYAMHVKEKLEKLGYHVTPEYVNCEDFGVPQQRTRFIMVGIRNDIKAISNVSPFELLDEIRPQFLKSKGLPNKPISVKEAISDLEAHRQGVKLVKHSGSDERPFKQLDYVQPKKLSAYQKAMRQGMARTEKPNSLRLARHSESTIENFRLIRSIGRPGVVLSKDEKEILGIKKQAICFLDKNKPSKTLTTLPDDILHYKEHRILTVRESARIQSFPDDFEFRGKYTTGGKLRTQECPRYTQVGNAVPPLLAEVLGTTLIHLKERHEYRKSL